MGFVEKVSKHKKFVRSGSECRRKEVEPEGNVYAVSCAAESGTPITTQSDVNTYEPAPSNDGSVGRYQSGVGTK